ncbi:MAG: beta strand repeat-containing protein, partial [Verrucomicrobiaceae bacterium]
GTKVLAVTSPTTFTLTANASGTTSTLSLSPLTPALTNTLNNTSVVGVLGGYITINKAIWAQSGLAGTGLAIVPSTNQVSTLATGAWNNIPANVNQNLDVASSITGSGSVGQLTFNTPSANTVSLNGPSIIRTGGILVTENVGANTSRLSGPGAASVSVLNCVTTAESATVNCTSTAGLLVNMAISGATIPAGSRVASLASATQFTLASGTGVTAGSGQTFTASLATSVSNVATTLDANSALTNILTTTSTAGIVVGMIVSGPSNIPAGSIVTTIASGTSFTISSTPTAAGTGMTFTLASGLSVAGDNSFGSSVRNIFVHQHNTAGPLVIEPAVTNTFGTNVGSTTPGNQAVSLTKSGQGTLIMLGNNIQTGGAFINEGTLRVGENGTLNANLGAASGAVVVNGTLILDASGAEARIAANGALRGDGTLTLAATNTRTWVIGGDNNSFGGTINVDGGVLALSLDPGDTNARGFGSNRSQLNIGSAGTIELRGSTTTTEENGIGQPITLSGKVRVDYNTVVTATFSVPRIDGPITIPDSAELTAIFESVATPTYISQVNINSPIYSNVGFTKTGNGRIVLNAQQTQDTLAGDTNRVADYTLLGQLRVNQGELWLSGNNRSAGAPGVGNEILVANGATLDLRDADLNFGDDAELTRKIVRIVGTGMYGGGALRNTAGTAVLSHLQLAGNATVGTGGVANGGRLELGAFDTNPITGASIGAAVTLSPSKLEAMAGNLVLTKVGTGDFVLRDTQVIGTFSQWLIKEGEMRIEMNVPPNAPGMTGELTPSQVQQIVIAYGGPGAYDITAVGGAVGPVVGARLEFYRNVDLHHDVPITMDGATAQSFGGTNYIDLSSDTVPGPRTYLDGNITLTGTEAKRNIFNIDGGNSQATTIGAQGNQSVEVQAKMIVGGQIVGAGGLSKIGFRELRLTNNNTYTGDTIITRSGNQALRARSDTVTINGVNYTTYGEAESWGEWGVTLNGNGRLSGTANIVLQRTGMLTLDNSNRLDASSDTLGSNLADRVNDNASILMTQGWLRLVGAALADSSEAVATGSGKSLQSLAGANIIDLWPAEDSQQDMLLTIGKITRAQGSVLRVRNLNADSNFTSVVDGGDAEEDVRVKVTDATSLTQVGSGATATSKAIVHGVLGGSAPNNVYEDTRITTDLYNQDRNRQNATGSGFMTLDNGFLRPLDDSEYATTDTGVVGSALAGQNVNLTDFNHYALDSLSINSLRFGPTMDTNGSGGQVGDSTRITSYTNNWQPTVMIDDNAVLTVASGMISSATFSHAGTGVNNSTFIRGGTVNFGAREGIINNQNFWLRLTDGTYQSNNFEIQSVIAGSGGVTKVGNPSVVFDAKNTYTGRTTINEGVLFARNGRNAFGADGRSVGNVPHTGNDILVQGGGDLRLTNGLQIGSAGAFKDLTVGVLNGANQILRSENGNNIFYGNIKLDNVDALGHTSHLGRPIISANGNQSLVIYGDIYGGETPVTEDILIADPRIITFNGTVNGVGGYISVRGQIGDRLVGGVAAPVAGLVTSRPSSVTETNENQVLRVQITASDDLNVVLDKQYKSAGRLSLDRGILLVNYDPASLLVGDTGFWTQAAIASVGTTSNSNTANGNTSSSGFLIGNNLGDGGGSAALF